MIYSFLHIYYIFVIICLQVLFLEEIKMSKLGMIRTAAATPRLKVANPAENEKEILKIMKEADSASAGILLLPELTITGYTSGDLFNHELLYQKQLESLSRIAGTSKDSKMVTVLGFVFRLENNLYNCAALIQGGKIRGIVPKMFMPNAKEFYEARWFASGRAISEAINTVNIFGYETAFGNLIFTDEISGLSLGIEVCEDLWLPITPGSHLALNGAHIILNPSASDETVGKSDYRRSLVAVQSAKSMCGYVYTSAGVTESTTDLVFSGHHIIAENGTVLAENERFERESSITYAEIDYAKLKFDRSQGHNMAECNAAYSDRFMYTQVALDEMRTIDSAGDKLTRVYAQNPFVPADAAETDRKCREIFKIQTAGYAKRMEHTHTKKSVVGISGGLDSTLALLVAAETHKLLGKPASDIVAVTMPGFGTTGKTYNNALTIMKLLGTEVREISIVNAVRQHFSDIGQDENNHDLTYENSQARERTQILMDIAGMENGLVVGTGDLSEAALGWCTYNGDHMAMYNVNAGIPKTLVRFVVKWVMDNKLSGPSEDKNFSSDNALLRATLQDILDTPISPELLPPEKDGSIAQKTEDSVGPYILHDFFIYHTLRSGITPEKLLFIAEHAFAGEYDRDFIKKWLKVFYRRFFSQQFKRSCIPDGPKVGSVSLSPRGDLRMPSDADSSLWLEEAEKL